MGCQFAGVARFVIVHILIVGGSGVLGSAITPHLRGLGHRVTVFGPESSSEQPGVDHIVADATDFDALAEACAGVDAVVNFALRTPRGPGADEQTEPVRAGFAVNVGSVYTQLRSAARARVPSFVQISTMAVLEGFGRRRRSARAESDSTTFYGLSKRMAELACQAEAARSPQLTVTVLRLAYPTREAWWPQWGNPVATEPTGLPSCGGREFAALHPADLAAAIEAAAARRGPYLCTAVTADVEEVSLGDQWPHPLGWQPRHVLGVGPEPAGDQAAGGAEGSIFVA